MKKHSSFWIRLPEPLLLLATIYSWMLTGTLVNPVPIAIIVLLVILMFSGSRILGQSLALLLVFISIYFMLAVVSEYSDFPVVNAEAVRLLVFGLGFFGISLGIATIMIWKYFR